MQAFLDRFHRDGFAVGPQILEGSALGRVRDAVDRILEERSAGMSRLLVNRRGGSGPSLQVHVVGASLAEEEVANLRADPEIVSRICSLMGRSETRFFRDQLFVKPPFSKGLVPWHQDYSDWTHTVPAEHITCWLALDDATEESGCLHYLSGSHKMGMLPKISAADDLESAWGRLPEEVRLQAQRIAVPIPAGGCVFHHCRTIHGSLCNSSGHPRRAIALAYMHPDTRSTGTRSAVPGGPVFPDGALLDHPLFPLLAVRE